MFRDDSYYELRSNKNSDVLSLLGPSNVSNIRILDSNLLQILADKSNRIIAFADDKKFEQAVEFYQKFNSDAEYFLCKVSGDDLKDCNIDKNSEIIIRRQNYALNGQIALVHFDGKYLFKKYYKNKELIYLMSGKNNVNKIDVSNEQFEIIGVVIEVINNIKKKKLRY